MCVDCIFESHSGHQMIKSGVIEDLYNQKKNNSSGPNKNLDDEYLKFEKNLKNKIDEIKSKLNEGVEKLYKVILEDFKKAKNKINNSEDADVDVDMDIIINNYPPKNKEELNKLVEELIKLYNNKNNANNEGNINKTNNRNSQEKKLLIENLIKYYDKILEEKKKDLENYII